MGLTTVKVLNFDNTITTIPTYTLVSGSFKTGAIWWSMAPGASSVRLMSISPRYAS
ncbi:hypothetical protein DMH27_04690 [Raoultella planticola]|nr:hypothetical protein [Raoultella planticola]